MVDHECVQFKQAAECEAFLVRKHLPKNFLNLVVLTGAILLYIAFFLLPQTQGNRLIRDDGWLSYLNVAVIVTVMIMTVVEIFRVESRSKKFIFLALSYVVLIYASREADFHRLFTEEHVTKWAFYADPKFPLTEKIVAGIIVIPFLVIFLKLILDYAKPIFDGFFRGDPWAVSIGIWGALLVSSQIVDKSSVHDYYAGRVTEEFMELTAAGYAVLAMVHYYRYFGQRTAANFQVNESGG